MYSNGYSIGIHMGKKYSIVNSQVFRLGWAGLGWAGLGQAGLGWAGLGWAGLWALGCAGLGWAGAGLGQK